MDTVVKKEVHCSLTIQFKDIEDMLRSRYPQLPEHVNVCAVRRTGSNVFGTAVVTCPSYVEFN